MHYVVGSGEAFTKWRKAAKLPKGEIVHHIPNEQQALDAITPVPESNFIVLPGANPQLVRRCRTMGLVLYRNAIHRV